MSVLPFIDGLPAGSSKVKVRAVIDQLQADRKMTIMLWALGSAAKPFTGLDFIGMFQQIDGRTSDEIDAFLTNLIADLTDLLSDDHPSHAFGYD